VSRTVGAMIPGHPYDTGALELLRASQRQVLAVIPTWRLERIDLRLDRHGVPEEHKAQAETALRDLTQREIIEPNSDLVVRMQGHTEGELLRFATHAVSDIWDSQLMQAVEALNREHRMNSVTDDEGLVIRELVINLTLADVLAGDGYMDPRVKVTLPEG